MNNFLELSEFVEGVFDLFNMDRTDFFTEYDDELNEYVEVPLFVGDEEYDNITLKRLSIYLGVTETEILNKDFSTLRMYKEKYPFFDLYHEYLGRWRWNSRYKNNYPSLEERFFNVLFREEAPIIGEERYDYKNVTKRMVAKLKEVDTVIPGTYHRGANIEHLQIDTEVFFSFPDCPRMLQSFIDMVNRVEELFFKALRTDLNLTEANELNFLASWLKATDVADTSKLITYNNVLMYRKVYIEENLTDFFSYVKIRSFVATEPWRCQEFFDDINLVQKIVNIYPKAKHDMREFALAVTKFSCYFVWSDAKPIMFSLEEEAELSAFNKIIGEQDTPLEERAKEPTHIYIDKTDDEMLGWDEFAKKLNDAASPPSKGGLELPVREFPPFPFPGSLDRLHARIDARGGNF